METTTRTFRKSPVNRSTRFTSASNKHIAINNLNKNDTRFENVTKQLLDLQSQLAEYDVDFNELKESNEFLINERLILEESLGEAEQKIVQLTSEKEELKKLVDDLKKSEFKTADLSTLQLHKIENENLKNELEFKKQEIVKCKSDLITKNNLIQQLTTRLDEKEKRVDCLKKQMQEQDNKMCQIENDLKDKIKQLRTDYESKDEQYNMVVSKYIKHRKVWEQNCEKANFEVKKLDEVLDNVIGTLQSKIELIGHIPEIKLLLDQLATDH